ncbi:hypothetical protein [Desulfovibrio sp. 86]|uniref:Uncharacterized protein n=1 Tax=uncultured Desulfovibrio sp. TaxID=167968 RepID=A0A212L506_9BACT|nr:hypothetical protein [Desulfovibrio sp. 86]SCM72557.1 hypothetical protein KL86DES1_20696 [uncultured Desulfovibrio sp.]VZH33598.1 conserved protein of unknown function [Desulfovibrio sp. 86]
MSASLCPWLQKNLQQLFVRHFFTKRQNKAFSVYYHKKDTLRLQNAVSASPSLTAKKLQPPCTQNHYWFEKPALLAAPATLRVDQSTKRCRRVRTLHLQKFVSSPSQHNHL